MMIKMSHPDMQDAEPAEATPEAFDEVWAAKGWTKVGEETTEADDDVEEFDDDDDQEVN
jgi:hypothetical protein